MSGFLKIDSGDFKREASILDLTESAAPGNTANVGKYYASSSDHYPHYISNTGTNYDLTIDRRVDAGTASGQMAYWDGNSWNHTETSELCWYGASKYLGLGTATPSYAFEISSSSASGAASALAITKAYNSSMGPYIWFFKARGTVASKANIAASDSLMSIGTQAWINSGWVSGTYINSEVVSTHTTYFAADIIFESRNSSNVMAERMRITSTNRVGIGTAAPGGTLGLLDSNTYITRDGSNNLSFTDYITGTRTLAQLAAATPPGGSNTYVQFNNSNAFGGDSNFTWNNSSKYLALGITTALSRFHMAGTSAVASTLSIQEASASAVGPVIDFIKSRGTLTSSTAVQDGDALGEIRFIGHTGSAFSAGASMYAKASQTWTTGTHGTNLYWETTHEGETSPTLAMVLDYDGFLGIGTESPRSALFVQGTGDSTANYITVNRLYDDSSGPGFVLEKCRGSSTSLDAGDILGFVSAEGSTGNVSTYYSQAGIWFETTEGWDGSNRGARIGFHTTPAGSTTRAEVVTISDEGFLGVGDTDPAYALSILGTDLASASVYVTRYSADDSGPYVTLGKGRGTPGSPSAVLSGDYLGSYRAGGYYSGISFGGSIDFQATQNWGATARGSQVSFVLNPTDSATQGVKVKITGDGHVGIGPDVTPTSALYVEGNSAGGGCAQLIRGYADASAASCPLIYLYKARGTYPTPTACLDNDRLALYAGGGYDGSNWAINGFMAVYADGTWTTSSRMTRLEFYTGQSGETFARLKMTIYGNGEIWMPYVYADTATSPRAMYIQSNGKLGGISSTRRHKKNIKAMRDIDFLYDLRPVNFVFKKDAIQETQYGLIAEEVEKVNKDFVFYNEDKIAGVHYDRLISVLIKADQEQKKRGESMEKTIKSLTEKVTTLQNKLNKLSGKGTTNTKHKATAKYKADGKKRGTKC